MLRCPKISPSNPKILQRGVPAGLKILNMYHNKVAVIFVVDFLLQCVVLRLDRFPESNRDLRSKHGICIKVALGAVRLANQEPVLRAGKAIQALPKSFRGFNDVVQIDVFFHGYNRLNFEQLFKHRNRIIPLQDQG